MIPPKQDHQKMRAKQFRAAAVDLFLRVRRQIRSTPLEIQFLSVAIFDKYLVNECKKKQTDKLNTKFLVPIVIACIRIASKFEGIGLPGMQKFADLFEWQSQLLDLEAKTLQAQLFVMVGIQFSVPMKTAYTTFLQNCTQKEMTSYSSQLVFKFLYCGLEYSPELSFHEEYGKRIYERIFSQKKDAAISRYMKKVALWVEAQSNNFHSQ